MAAFSAAPFIDPAIGPLVGGFLGESWRMEWLYWIRSNLSVLIFNVHETYAPTIIPRRAKGLRKETGNESYVTEQVDRRPLGETLQV
ncbi:hypothetical protein BGX38DRAFT_1268728 [Terfezia claveryi]|nr:hypothetical protein BGX38DRAFT_1268728 [Terfezia claveryi]